MGLPGGYAKRFKEIKAAKRAARVPSSVPGRHVIPRAVRSQLGQAEQKRKAKRTRRSGRATTFLSGGGLGG